jgi:hypothetical protein
MLHACLCTICFVFCYTLWRLYAFSGTNLLMRCHSASSLFSSHFCVSKKLHRKYSRNWMKQKPKFLFFPTWDGVQSRDGGGPGASHTIGCRWWGHLAHLPTPPFHLYILLSEENLNHLINFPQNILQAAIVIDARSGGSRSSSRHPAGEGNHHQRPSSSPCLPPEWCVGSLPWTTGP